MTSLLNFYRGQGADPAGRRLEDILAWDDPQLEEVHDFIQWLFPLPEPSRFNPDAPLLTQADRQAFHQESVLQNNLKRSFRRFLAFLGLRLNEHGQVEEGDQFGERAREVWDFPNHNWLRVTRLLRSCTLLGMAGEALALLAWLEEQHQRRRWPISNDTMQFWRGAVAHK